MNKQDFVKQLQVGSESFSYYDITSFRSQRLPYSLRILLENLLRTFDGKNVAERHLDALQNWDPSGEPDTEIQFTPARVVMQDFTGVPCVVDLATMREAIAELGGDPRRVNPLAPAELVIDHSVVIDVFGSADAAAKNVEFEYQRNAERYQFLRWGQGAFDNFKVVPPGTGIVHQVNLEYLARGVMTRNESGMSIAYPDSCVGTDSHTTMINGLGVLGWGVGGIEAEAAMLGQPVSTFSSVPPYLEKTTRSPTLTSSGIRASPSSLNRPGPTATTSASWGFSLAVSGITRPDAVTCSASMGRTTMRSSSGFTETDTMTSSFLRVDFGLFAERS